MVKPGVLILAAGKGLRMLPLTASTPKPLLPVAGKPLLEHAVLALKACGLTEIVLLVGWQEEKIKAYFGNGEKFGVKITYVTQAERLGTAHATSMVKGVLKGDFLSINGDVVITEALVKDIIALHEKTKGNVIAACKVDNPSSYGILQVDGENRVKKIVEKPREFVGNLANTGVYLFTPEIFKAIEKTKKSARGEYEITDSLQFLADEGKVFALPDSKVVDVTDAWGLLAANAFLSREPRVVQGVVQEGVTLEGPVKIARGAVVKSGSRVIAPAFIGENVEIGASCVIGPNACICNDCKIGSECRVENALIMKGAVVKRGCRVVQSVIGEGCELGEEARVEPLDLVSKRCAVLGAGSRVARASRVSGVIQPNSVVD